MPRQLNLDLPDDLYGHMLRAAAQAGQTLEKWVLARLRSQILTPEDRARALADLLRQTSPADGGALGMPPPEGIDAELAREYADTHDPVP